MKLALLSIAALLCSVSNAASFAAAPGAGQFSPTFGALQGEVLLDNERVHVQRFIVHPGQSTGNHAHRNAQLLIFIRGGVLTGATGRSTLWKDGRVQWFDGNGIVDEGRKNTGSNDIEIVCVTLKPLQPGATPPAHKPEPLSYPNIPGEDLLENEWVIVQRFVVNPGQWEGVHAHQPNMLFVHIKGGQWGARSRLEAQHAYPHPSPDGGVGWMEPIDIGVGHESGNIGNAPIDLVWVSLKK